MLLQFELVPLASVGLVLPELGVEFRCSSETRIDDVTDSIACRISCSPTRFTVVSKSCC